MPISSCTIDGCERLATVRKHGWCSMHYLRWQRHGDPTIVLRGPDAPVPESKLCSDCLQVKSMEDFSPGNNKMKGGRASYCRPCAAVRMKVWREANPERRREHMMRSHERRAPTRAKDRMKTDYGITFEQFEAMLAAQGRVCAICQGTKCHGNGTRFHVDHDHHCCPRGKACGKCLRGLLCGNCNTMIGLAGEDPDRLIVAAEYLRGHKQRVEARVNETSRDVT